MSAPSKVSKSTLCSMIIVCMSVFLISGCSKKDDATVTGEASQDSHDQGPQTSLAASSSSASASEGGAVGLLDDPSELFQNLSDFVDPRDAIHPNASSPCSYSTARSTCANSSDTIDWNGCTLALGKITMTGGWTETFSGTNAATCAIPVVSGGAIVRTATSSVATISDLTGLASRLNGSTVTTDTTGGTAWDGTAIPSTGISITNSGGTRSVAINGLHRVMKGPAGKVHFDHFVRTSTNLSMTGTRLAGTRTIASGVVEVYHNLAKYTVSNSFSSVVWADNTCCYPTSGTIASTFTGTGLTGNSTLTFTSTCGEATFLDTTGATGTIQLTHCN